MKFIADKWAAHKKSTKFPIFYKTTLELRVAGVGEILVFGIPHDDEGGLMPRVLLAAGHNHLYVREAFEGFAAIEIEAKEFGLTAKLDGVEIGEAMNKQPAPAPKPPSNLIQKMRAKVKEEMGVTREFFANDTFFPGYEVDDDADFEEVEALRTTPKPTPAPEPEPQQPDQETEQADK